MSKFPKAAFLSICLLASPAVIAQSPDSLKYAPRTIMLVSTELGTEGIVPMVFSSDGQQRLEYVPTSQIKDSITKGGQPIRLGDLLSVLVGATETINKLQAENARLQAENDKLWKVAMKDAPPPQQPTVVVQQPPSAPQPSTLEKYLLLRSLLPTAQPYQLPAPVNPNANRLHTNCVTTRLGDTSTTNCN
jgi:hypothetical protein